MKVTATRWTTNQLLALGASASGRRTGLALQEPRYNPKPPGVIQQGSATDRVLALLREHDGHWMRCAEIIVRTGCTAKAVSWALVYLSAVQLIERSNSDERNPRYLRYRVTTK